MLGIATVADRRATYYLDDLGDELGRVAPAHAGDAASWVGRSAADLGLSGPVGASTLRAVLDGRDPRRGRPLVRSRRSVAAYDLTFCAPKSVSLLFAFGGADATRDVLASHNGAVVAALDHLERRALAVRRGTVDERTVVATDGMVGASFVHCLSRAGDPHLHSHVVAANLAHGVDGRWSAVDGRGLFAHARAVGAIYGTHLRAELSDRLGVSWSWRDGSGWELGGTDPLLGAVFSGRRAEVRQQLAVLGTHSRRAKRVAWASTRSEKDRSAPAQLASIWAARARVAGGWRLTPPAGRERPERHGDRLDEYRFAAAIARAGPSGVCRRDVIEAWSESLAGGTRAVEVDQAVEHWAPSAGEVGVAETRRAPSMCVPSPHLLRALGPRPASADAQPVWRHAAAVIDRYRTRWGVSHERGLGAERAAPMPPLHLADHIEVSRTIRDALIQMGEPARRDRVLER